MSSIEWLSGSPLQLQPEQKLSLEENFVSYDFFVNLDRKPGVTRYDLHAGDCHEVPLLRVTQYLGTFTEILDAMAAAQRMKFNTSVRCPCCMIHLTRERTER